MKKFFVNNTEEILLGVSPWSKRQVPEEPNKTNIEIDLERELTNQEFSEITEKYEAFIEEHYEAGLDLVEEEDGFLTAPIW